MAWSALAFATSAAALCGDADGSGAAAINDVVRHLRVVSGIDAETALCGGAGFADCADLNGDGTGATDISDTVLLLRRASSIANCAPDLCLPKVVLAGCPGTAVLPATITGSLTVPAGCDARLHGVTMVEQGGIQFGLVAQRAEDLESGGSHGIEMDNSEFGADKLPRSDGKYCNVTAIGARYSAANPGVTNQFGIFSRRGNAMTIANTIVKDFRQAGYQMRDAATAARACLDPTTLATTPPVGVIRNSLFPDNGAGGTSHAVNHSTCDAPGECTCTTTEHFALLQAERAVLATADATVEAVGGNTFPPVDLVPPAGSLPDTHAAADCTTIHPAFVDAPYIGAFAPGGDDWTAGWADYPLN